MNLLKSRTNKISFVIVAITIILIGLLLNWGKASVNAAILNSAISETERIGAQLKLYLEEALEEGIEDLTLIAKYMSNERVTEESAVDFLISQSHAEKFNVLYYVDLHGQGVMQSGERRDFSNNKSFLNALKKDSFIDNPRISHENDEMVFDIAVPVIIDDELSAVLCSQLFLDAIFDISSEHTKGNGDVFIVDYNLNLIFSTSENHINTTIIPPQDIIQMGFENVAQAQKDFVNKKNGSFYYQYDGTPKVMTYMPIAMTDWVLAINVKNETLTTELASASRRQEAIGDAVYWIVIVLVMYIGYASKKTNAEIEKKAYYDSLTGLPNMSKFQIDIKNELTKNPHKKYVLQKLDLAKFSVLNELYGHKMGDKVLLTISDIMKEITQNIEKTFICARVGVDEFLMFSGNGYLEADESARYSSERDFKERLPELSEYEFLFRYGRYFIEEGENDVLSMIGKVTLAHNMARLNPHQKTWDYNDAYRQEIHMHTEINNKRQRALDNNEFTVFLQPKFSISDTKLVGAEALVRWIEADGNIIYPNRFIPLFEKNGFIVEIDTFVLENVCKMIRRWLDKGYTPITVSVNCSRLNLNSSNFVRDVIAIVDTYSVPHEFIEIELTESTTIENEKRIEKLFEELHEHGIKISIDDFGAGYSSLGMLKNLQADTLKLDRSFFAESKIIRRDDMLIDGIVKMSHNLGMYVVAEGIETEDQIELLRTMNCDAVQGFVHAKPMKIEDFERLYSDALSKNGVEDNSYVPFIKDINDTKFANSFVPCGILITEIDEYFTIVEANKGYFDLVGFTRDEVHFHYKNRAIEMFHPQDIEGLKKYFLQKITSSLEVQLEYVCRIISKDNNWKVIHIHGRVTENEKGISRLYCAVSDITNHIDLLEELEKEKSFSSALSSLTDTVLFDYDIAGRSIRFSKRFSESLGIPDVVENFPDSEIRKKYFDDSCNFLLDDDFQLLDTQSYAKEVKVYLPSGDIAWYFCNYTFVCDVKAKKERIVGKMTDVSARYALTESVYKDLEKDMLTELYNEKSAHFVIQKYLNFAAGNEKGALLLIDLCNYYDIHEQLGQIYSDVCLKEVAELLQSTFRTVDVLARFSKNTFIVFLKDYKDKVILDKKLFELKEGLNKTYIKQEKTLRLESKVSIAHYPEDGTDFRTLCKKLN